MRKTSPLRRQLGAILASGALLSAAAASCSDGADEQAALSAGCPDDLAFFEANIWKPIMAQKCAVCHSADGLARNSKLVLRPPSEAGYMETNFAVVRQVAAMSVDGVSVLLLRPSARHPQGHTGGELIPFDGPDYKTFSTFVDRVTKAKGCDAPSAVCKDVIPGARSLRRLSRSEYDATIHDLFGIDSTWGASFTSDIVVNGFDNNSGALRVTPLLADQIRRAAEEIADLTSVNLQAILPCQPAPGSEDACAGQFIDAFGAKAFRRPLTPADHDRYLALYSSAATDGFTEGVKLVITAMLQSPYFLYRSELGPEGAASDAAGMVQLTPHEIAAELSYFIWGTTPDAALTAKAGSGELAKPDVIEAEARRLLQDPKADVMIGRFMEEWLELDRLPTVPKDAATYPELNDIIRTSMHEEARRFFRQVVRGGAGTYPELMTANYSFIDDTLAQFYGVPAPSGPKDAAGFGQVDMSAEDRAGALTLGGVLVTHSRPNASSPIHRGKLVRERVLCQDLPPPPPGLNVQPPPFDAAKSTRERYEAHATMEPCLSCHKLIDPIGFGFEHFDGIGRYRADENGQTIDVTGAIVATPATDGPFSGTADLAKKIAGSSDARACFARQWLRFAYGLQENAALSCLVDKVSGDYSGGDLKIEELIVALTATRHFKERVADGSEAATPSSSGSSSSGGGGSSSSSSGGDPGGTTPGLDVVEVEDTKWETGYCHTVKITNTSGAKVQWVVKLKITGTLTDAWNAIETPDGEFMKFVGESYNNTLDPGAMTSFGFCASI